MTGYSPAYSLGLLFLVMLTAGVAYLVFWRGRGPGRRGSALHHFGTGRPDASSALGIIQQLRDSVIILDLKDAIVEINSAACKWLQVDRAVIGRGIFDVLRNPDALRKVWETPDAYVLLEMKESDSQHWYHIHINGIRDDQGVSVGRIIVAHDTTQEQVLLEAEKRKSAQLNLLEEAGRQIADSLDEREILQRTVEAVVKRFGYVEAAISLLINEHELEVTAISGTQDYGFGPGYRQEVGAGIIGHVGKTCRTYVADDVSQDPYYFSNTAHEGSAIGVPIMNERELIGVLYVESAEKGGVKADDTQMMVTLANQVASSLQKARLYANMQEHLRIVSIVQSVSRVISSSLELEQVFQTVVKLLRDKLGYRFVSIYLLEENYLHLGAQIGYPEETMINPIHISKGVAGLAATTRQVQYVTDVSDNPVFLRASNEIHSEICVPLLKEETVLGILNVEADPDSTLTQRDLELLTLLAGPIALAVDNAQLHSKVKEMAMTDAVTGLFNRRAFEEMLNAEATRSQRFGQPFSLIIFDLDSFKTYNDLWGHPAGDERLKATAELIQTNLRKYDIAARYGGDEFAIILPNSDKAGAMHLAGRLLEAARGSAMEMSVAGGDVVPGYTLSIGVATYPQDGTSLASLMVAADQAELTAKRSGKNQICSAGDLHK